jgi:poly(3-hydroxybutyrate) depolymerase
MDRVRRHRCAADAAAEPDCGNAGDLPHPRLAGGHLEVPSQEGAVPVIVFHGDRDTTVHPRNGEQVILESVDRNAASNTLSVEQGRVPGGHAYTRTVHSDPTGRVILEHWLVHGAGHAWSGGSARGSYTDPKGPDAAREMIRFFY